MIKLDNNEFEAMIALSAAYAKRELARTNAREAKTSMQNAENYAQNNHLQDDTANGKYQSKEYMFNLSADSEIKHDRAFSDLKMASIINFPNLEPLINTFMPEKETATEYQT